MVLPGHRLRRREDDVQGDGGQVPDDEGQRHRGLRLLEQRQLHRPRHDHQVSSSSSSGPGDNFCSAGAAS